MNKHFSIVLCGILSTVVLHTCIQIEVWNYLAGGDVLPNREGGKLRHSIESEKGWRMMRGWRTQDPTLEAGRPLTNEEHQIFLDHQKYASRRNKVVTWSGGMGTLQYLLAPLAIIWSGGLVISGKSRTTRVMGGIFVFMNLICICSMLYRGYFND